MDDTYFATGQKVYESKLVSEKSTLNLSGHNLKGVYFSQLHNDKGFLLGERKIIFNNTFAI